ncbi:hypothetical protein DTL42_22990 [Bremerella cremea]|uniref:Uncharacterized protein n=2 Tax=Bremerella cremea TaxID=1031537 RepID=A0A368KKW9_9BACT|nr:hypothetical protein DTL42_22990 [Bremerella cremea]
MIEIAEPGGNDPPSEKARSKAVVPPVASPPQVTASAPPPAETAPAETAPVESAQTAAEASNSDELFDNIDDMLDAAPAAEPTPTQTVAASQPPTAEEAPAAAAPPAPIDAGRFSNDASVGKWRNVALIGGTSVMALATIAVIGYALLSESSPTPIPAEDPTAQQVAQADTPSSESPVDNTSEVEPAAPEEPQPVPEEGTSEAADTPNTPEETTEPPQTEDKPAETEEASPPAKTPKIEENPFLFGQPEEEPVAEKPAEKPPEANKPAVAATPKSILELKDDPLYEVFGPSFPVFDPDALEASANTNPGPVAAASVPAAEPAPTPQLVPPIQEVDVAARLRDPIVEIQLKDMPLNEFTSFVTQMSTAPVTLDPLALAYAEIGATKPISVQQSQTSVEGILRAAVHPFGLDVVATQHSARLQITQPLDGHERTMRLQVDDMASDAKEVADLAYLLTRLVEPLSWNHSRGKGLYRVDPDAIMITQNEVAQFKSMVFLEKMRVARGLTPKSSYSQDLFNLKSRTDQLAPALGKSVNLQIVVPTPMYKVIDQLEKKTGLDILCDWDSLALNKLGPATPVTLTASGTTAGETLNHFCKSWKLAALPINSHTVQLVSESSAPVMPWIEFYDIREMNLGKSQATAMINAAKRELSDLRKTGYGEVLYDPVSKQLLALLSQGDHQRLRQILQRRMAP